MRFPFFKQQDAMDCGPTCLRMVAKHYGKNIAIQELRKLAEVSKEGVSLLGISNAAEKIGFKTRVVKITFNDLIQFATKPAILHWGQNHFVVISPKSSFKKIHIADPAKNIIHYTKKEFLQQWLSNVATQNGEKFESLGTVLSRDEAKKIVGGLAMIDDEGVYCHVNRPCTLYVSSENVTYSGQCSSGWGGGSGGYMPCGCETSYGPYVPTNNGGSTTCQS